MNKVKIFNKLNDEVKNLESKVLSIQDEILLKKNNLDELIKDIFESFNKELEKCIVEWVLNNPIEAVSYYRTKELGIDTIYYKNDNKYTELFEDNIDSDIEYDYGYNLINVNTLENIVVNVEDICNHYSALSCNNGSFLELDFLNNYKVDLIKEVGHFYDDNNWSIEYKILSSKSYSNSIYRIVKNNFIINEIELEHNKVKLLKENIEDLISQYSSELELNYNYDRTFSIHNDSDLIGFICLGIDKGLENEHVLNIDSFEILPKYRGLGFGSKVIHYLMYTYGLDIVGYSIPNDKIINFWAKNGAEFDSCEHCEENPECGGFECDNPLDYYFIIPIDYI